MATARAVVIVVVGVERERLEMGNEG